MYAPFETLRPILLVVILTGGVCVSIFAQDERGEAKRASEESMKKVDDGKPILTGNMIQHTMKAQMYRSQQNFAKAAEEDMKAQLLKEQLRENNESREKNEKRRDQAIYSSDSAQNQLPQKNFTSPRSSSNTPALSTAPSRPTLSGLFSPIPAQSGIAGTQPSEVGTKPLPAAPSDEISTEFIIFDETVARAESDPSMADLGKNETVATSTAPETDSKEDISADFINRFQQDLGLSESQFIAASAASSAANTPIQIDSADKQKKQEEDEAFWKVTKKQKKKESTRRRIAHRP